jgi:hypothetical protein
VELLLGSIAGVLGFYNVARASQVVDRFRANNARWGTRKPRRTQIVATRVFGAVLLICGVYLALVAVT